MRPRSERTDEMTSSGNTTDATAVSSKRIQLLKERLELYNATIAEALGAATAFASARKERATEHAVAAAAAADLRAGHSAGGDGSNSDSSNKSDNPSLATSSRDDRRDYRSGSSNDNNNNDNCSDSKGAGTQIPRPNVEINVTRLRSGDPRSAAAASSTTNTTVPTGGHSIRRGIGAGLRVPPSRTTQLERNLNSEFVAATNVADTAARPRHCDPRRSPAATPARDAKSEGETVTQNTEATDDVKAGEDAATAADATGHNAASAATMADPASAADATHAEETGSNGETTTTLHDGAANSRQPSLNEAVPSFVDASPGIALEARTRALLQRAAELYRTHQRSRAREEPSPSAATAPTTTCNIAHEPAHHRHSDNNHHNTMASTTDTSITSLTSSTTATSTATSSTTTATTTPTTSRETSHSFMSSASSGLSSLLHQAAAFAAPQIPDDPTEGQADSHKEDTTSAQDSGREGVTLQQARRDAMDALEVAYNQLSLARRRTTEVSEVMGVDAFPRTLPHHDTVEQVRAHRIALTAAEAELSLHPPEGPTLQAIHDTDGTRLQEAITQLLTGCSAALACLTVVEDRRARLKERQKLARQRQDELMERQQARQLIETEVAQLRARLQTRRRQLQDREETYLRKFNEHDAASERIQGDINEVEQLGKTVAAWLKILEEREEHLAEKEEKLHRVQVDLARRSEDLQLCSAVLGARAKQPQPPPPRVSM